MTNDYAANLCSEFPAIVQRSFKWPNFEQPLLEGFMGKK